MGLVFDTNVLIEMDFENRKLLEKLKDLSKEYPANPSIAFPTLSEYYYGFLNRSKNKGDFAIKRLSSFNLLNSSEGSAKLFAEIKYNLDKNGKSIPLMDVLIASIVMDHKFTLLTFDNQFKRINGLKVIILDI